MYDQGHLTWDIGHYWTYLASIGFDCGALLLKTVSCMNVRGYIYMLITGKVIDAPYWKLGKLKTAEGRTNYPL